jgi:thiamine pyrophosphate-dependent acetolactate synthase large subunit-like protein
MSKGSDLFVAALENEGVERIFGVPGEENLDVLDSLRGSKIKFILTRHEQPAAFMAATYGRLTGKPGVCLSTLGPGAVNFSTGAAYALLGAMPMILITGQKGILSSKQGRFQIVDVVASMTPLTKMARQIVSTTTIPSIVREAFRVAQQERPGPYGMIRWKQAVDKFPDWGLTFGNPDFVRYAESYSAKGSRVEGADGLVPALETAFKAGGVYLVTVPVDYSENNRVLVDELRNRVPAPATA